MSPRGGPRMGAGRPKVDGELRTASLAGVHIQPSKLVAYREASMRANLSLTAWVELHLDKAAASSFEEDRKWIDKLDE